jgi:hypothetical protein
MPTIGGPTEEKDCLDRFSSPMIHGSLCTIAYRIFRSPEFEWPVGSPGGSQEQRCLRPDSQVESRLRRVRR